MRKGNWLFKTIGIALLALFAATLLAGCYDSREIDDMAYVVSLGLDKGKTNALRLTIQIAIPVATGAGSSGNEGGGGGEGSDSSFITTIETPTLYSGLNMANNYISKQLNMSHAKVIVISEEIAREGVQRYVNAIMRGREFRGNMFVLVSKGKAEEFIKETKPKFEVNPAKYFELNLMSYRYTGFIANTQLINFYLQEKCTCSQAVAILGGVNRFQSAEDFDLNGSTYLEKGKPFPMEGDFIAGEVPRIGMIKSEFMGLAVFDGDKMVGELDGEEANYYLMLTGKYENSFFTVPDPLVKDYFVVLSLKTSRPPERKVTMSGDIPHISAKVKLEADILSIQSGKNYEDPKNVHLLEAATEEYIRNSMQKLLYKTSKELKTDIFGFGKSIKGTFLTWQDWIDFNWLDKYKNATFDVSVDFKIRRPGLMIRSTPIYSSEGMMYD
ncbi:MAG TPA: Ger(x)C family spore germination protein [Clostridiaceae bacterium]|nr:Ger(x)C family spore germination protein [Clostridiaceae bacterium]